MQEKEKSVRDISNLCSSSHHDMTTRVLKTHMRYEYVKSPNLSCVIEKRRPISKGASLLFFPKQKTTTITSSLIKVRPLAFSLPAKKDGTKRKIKRTLISKIKLFFAPFPSC